MRVFQLEVVGIGVREVECDRMRLGKFLDRRFGWREARRGFEVAHRGKVVALAHVPLHQNLAVKDKTVALGRRIGKTVGSFNRKNIVACRWHRELPAPAHGVVVRRQLPHRQRVFPICLDFRLGERRHRAPGPVRCRKKLGRQPFSQSEGCPRNRHARSRGQRGALRIENRRASKLIEHAVQRRNRTDGRAHIISQDGKQ